MKSANKALLKTVLAVMIIIGSSLSAIILHAVLPAQADASLLDGFLVRRYGFPAVASAYFLVLFTHCAGVLLLNRNRLISTNLRPEISFALSFSFLYMIGMQEIVLSLSPFAQWGISFVSYQLVIGIGDAVPVLILCLLIGKIFFIGRKNEYKTEKPAIVFPLIVFMVVIGTVRLIASQSGVIKSGILEYAFPVAVWGYLLGLVFGIVYLLVETTTSRKMQTMLLGIGVNWMIFNSFIGLIQKDAMPDALLRSTIDLATVFAALKLSAMIKGKRLTET